MRQQIVASLFLKHRHYRKVKAQRIYSNKLTNQVHQSLSFIACRLNKAQHVSSILMSIIRSLSTTVAASGLPLERGGNSVVGRGRYLNDRQKAERLIIWLVDLFDYMMMHGTTNSKPKE
jgi:hypothetical protein